MQRLAQPRGASSPSAPARVAAGRGRAGALWAEGARPPRPLWRREAGPRGRTSACVELRDREGGGDGPGMEDGSAPAAAGGARRGACGRSTHTVPVMMDEALGYLEKRQVAFKYCEKYGSDKVRVIKLVKNRGKGGAVRMGVFSSRGKKILMADADGATKFPDVEKLEKGLNDLQPWPDQMAIACGSRAHLEKESIAQRSYFRTLLMYGFHFLVWFLCVKGIRDTQCGFKLLTREAASRTFSSLHIERWAFDVELLYIAQFFKIPIAEIAVNWTEIEGSKLVPFWSWLQMGKDLLFIRLRYLTGAWRLEQTRKMN
ncbi:dolichyl-phosphate beta-glucosyltransferase isoform X3 [Oryctolagus cuniculus]|uniref:dolichyl-phosphate beta-glucosyltransferase isoform X3 n=1 Tax=Oryctolagus cuniculus TaxID=9986 RepID=UPI002232B599|nr:dolichyl-phosphate beta-glucosyltransferase isoform X3 [Oryctolagus cuniculus]